MSTFVVQKEIKPELIVTKEHIGKIIRETRIENKLNNDFVGFDILTSHMRKIKYIELVFLSNSREETDFYVLFEDHHISNKFLHPMSNKYFVVNAPNIEYAKKKIRGLVGTEYSRIVNRNEWYTELCKNTMNEITLNDLILGD